MYGALGSWFLSFLLQILRRVAFVAVDDRFLLDDMDYVFVINQHQFRCILYYLLIPMNKL